MQLRAAVLDADPRILALQRGDLRLRRREDVRLARAVRGDDVQLRPIAIQIRVRQNAAVMRQILVIQTEGIDPAKVLIIPNAVDLRRIPSRPEALPARPRRAIAFGKASAVPEIGAACEHAGLEFTAIGMPVGRISAQPEQDLVKYDVVFASARAALEALCCGCAVVVCDGRGMGGMITSRNFQALRARNFGLRTLVEPLTRDTCLEQLQSYDAQDAALAHSVAAAGDVADLAGGQD